MINEPKEEFTQGPWHLTEAGDGSLAIDPEVGFCITPVSPREGFKQDIPNFKLMAASPMLYKALKMFVTEYEGNGHDERELRPEMIAARNAFKQVFGE